MRKTVTRFQGCLIVLVLAMLTADIGTAAAATTTPAEVTLVGLDLHDGTVVLADGTYYLYGTEYGCGFTWRLAHTPWCGFGVRSAKSLTGPWSAARLLFSPSAKVHTPKGNWPGDNRKTWDWVCGSDGAGCFNPRMVHEPDGKWLLWFNAPGDTMHRHANAYWVLGCDGPLGPCGSSAGGRDGFDHKPKLTVCDKDGDFSIITDGTSAAILCQHGTLAEEQLASSWIDGDGVGHQQLAGLTRAEGEGAYRLPNGTWEMTYSLPGCGYCTGPPTLKSAAGPKEVQTGYATAPSMLGPWTAHGVLSTAYCVGQPRTVFTVRGQAYEWIDSWTGSPNETQAGFRLEPMDTSAWSCS
jgi:hypothetical protein